MSSYLADGDRGPIADLNTTPLATHAVKVNLPGPSPEKQIRDIDPTKNIITLTNDGAIRWNGRFVNREELRARLNAAGAMLLQPQLLLRPEAGTRYELVDSVLADIKRAGTEKLAFVGNEQFSRF